MSMPALYVSKLDAPTGEIVMHRMTPVHREILAWILSLPSPVRVVRLRGRSDRVSVWPGSRLLPALARPTGPPGSPRLGKGYCIFSNVSIAIEYARAVHKFNGWLVDYDVHHGNGAQDTATPTS
jgi:hypothetical protein